MPLVPMFYDPNVVTDDMIAHIIPVAQQVFAEKLGTPSNEGGSLTPDMILIRPIPHHPWAPGKRVLEFVVSTHHYPARMENADGLAEGIGDRLAIEIREVMAPDGSPPLSHKLHWDCFVQLELCEIGYAPFQV